MSPRAGANRFAVGTQNAATITSGGKLSVTSGGAARITGSDLTAATDLELQATGDVTIDSSADRYDHEITAYKKKTITQNRANLKAGGDVTVGSLVGNLALISSELQANGDITLNAIAATPETFRRCVSSLLASKLRTGRLSSLR